MTMYISESSTFLLGCLALGLYLCRGIVSIVVDGLCGHCSELSTSVFLSASAVSRSSFIFKASKIRLAYIGLSSDM
ncbi:hypothetical protein EV424DRAFT_833132 [Suillus variegatus]|nr:hypothetical protein EV424DRAFT_833132 [Suillus variegatus]